MLPVQHERDIPASVYTSQASPVTRLFHGVKKFVSFDVIMRLGRNLPKQERANWVTSHERVKSRGYLLGRPYKLPLHRRQKERRVDTGQYCCYGFRLVAH